MNEHVPPATSEPTTADELRDDIEKTRDELAESVDALSSKLDVKAQGRRKLRDAKTRVREAGRAVSRTKQKAPAPIQKAADATERLFHRTVGKLAPPMRRCARQVKAHRKPLGAGAGLAVLTVVVRRRRGGRDA